MYIYDQMGIRIAFDGGILCIDSKVLTLRIDGNSGVMTADGCRWNFVQPEAILSVSAAEADNNGRSEPHVRLTLQTASGSENWTLFPDQPFICTDCHPDGRVFSLNTRHIQITSVELVDKTDYHDSLVKTEVHQYYKKHTARGNMFLLEDAPGNRGLLLVKHAPCPDSAVRRAEADLLADSGGNVVLYGCRYGAAYGAGQPEKLFAAYRRLYRKLCCQPAVSFIMSNTWGDRSRDAAMREDFVLRELECAHELGVDIVQLDDGWQKGISSNSVHAVEQGGVFEGFYAFDPDFWSLDPVKFPGGMDVILEKAESLGIDMGLWFAPDSSEDFGNWEKDVDVVRTMVERHGAKYIKLDGVVLRSEACEKNYLSMLDAISTLNNGNLQFNLDITNDERLGYFCGIPYGTLFVENRYSDWKNYYPHNTLRNLWQLSAYVPAVKFQFEVLNPRRNAELYGDDPLAPDTYDIDWLFASVMPANPLIWMEMQHLTPDDAEALRKIIAVYREHRAAMSIMEVSPIGMMPNGVNWTGFHWEGENGGYLVVLRGITENDTFGYTLPGTGKKYELLHSNTEASLTETEAGLKVTLAKKRGYAFVRYTNR
ncbi:MAG: alpha-galactosidase [Clostridia bacterium]|nr:alpha-galactosidase [Clostridia bacterium]